MVARTSSPSNGARASTAAPAHGRLVLARGEDRRESTRRRRSRRARPRSIRGPAARSACVVNSISRREDRVAHRLALAARPRRDLDHGDVVVGEEREQLDVGVRCGQLGGAAADARGPGRASPRSGPVSSAVPSRSRAPRAAIRTLASGLARPAVAVARSDECPAMTTSRRLGPVIAARLSRLVSRTTVHATPNATTVAAMAPVTMASPPLAMAAQHPADGPRPPVKWCRLVVDEDRPPLASPLPAWLSGLRSGRLTPPSEDEGSDGEAGDPCGLSSEPVDGERESDRHAGANDSGARLGRAARQGPAAVVATPLVVDPDGGRGVRHLRRRSALAGLLPVRARRRRAEHPDRRGPADAVRAGAVVGATRRRAGHVRRARGSRRAVPAVGQLLLRHRHRARRRRSCRGSSAATSRRSSSSPRSRSSAFRRRNSAARSGSSRCGRRSRSPSTWR